MKMKPIQITHIAVIQLIIVISVHHIQVKVVRIQIMKNKMNHMKNIVKIMKNIVNYQIYLKIMKKKRKNHYPNN